MQVSKRKSPAVQVVVSPKEKVSLLNFVSIRALHGELSSAVPRGLGEVRATLSADTMVQSCAAALRGNVDPIKAAAVA